MQNRIFNNITLVMALASAAGTSPHALGETLAWEKVDPAPIFDYSEMPIPRGECDGNLKLEFLGIQPPAGTEPSAYDGKSWRVWASISEDESTWVFRSKVNCYDEQAPRCKAVKALPPPQINVAVQCWLEDPDKVKGVFHDS